MAGLDKCYRNFSTIDMSPTIIDLSNKICVPNKTKDANSRVFEMVTGISKIKHISKAYFRGV